MAAKKQVQVECVVLHKCQLPTGGGPSRYKPGQLYTYIGDADELKKLTTSRDVVRAGSSTRRMPAVLRMLGKPEAVKPPPKAKAADKTPTVPPPPAAIPGPNASRGERVKYAVNTLDHSVDEHWMPTPDGTVEVPNLALLSELVKTEEDQTAVTMDEVKVALGGEVVRQAPE